MRLRIYRVRADPGTADLLAGIQPGQGAQLVTLRFAASKTVSGGSVRREFESLPLRLTDAPTGSTTLQSTRVHRSPLSSVLAGAQVAHGTPPVRSLL